MGHQSVHRTGTRCSRPLNRRSCSFFFFIHAVILNCWWDTSVWGKRPHTFQWNKEQRSMSCDKHILYYNFAVHVHQNKPAACRTSLLVFSLYCYFFPPSKIQFRPRFCHTVHYPSYWVVSIRCCLLFTNTVLGVRGGQRFRKQGRKRRLTCTNMMAQPARQVKKLEYSTQRIRVVSLSTPDVIRPLFLQIANIFFPKV